MQKTIPKKILFPISILVAFCLYWPLMHGTPIWDDVGYWFNDPVMKPDFSYLKIWKDFGWPLSVSIQKFLFSIFDKNYLFYHLFSFLIHSANAVLVYYLGRYLRIKHLSFFFLLFLFHPVAVMATGWMIQLKTLLCFFFALASLLAFLKGHKDLKWMGLSWFLFFLSVLAKSSSITMPLIFLAISFKVQRWQKIHFLLPFFLIASWSGYRVLTSSVTTEGSAKAAKVTEIKSDVVVEQPKESPTAEPQVNIEAEPKSEDNTVETTIDNTPPEPEKKPEPEVTIDTQDQKTSLSFINFNFDLLLQTNYYYFWQTFLPVNTTPVRGLNTSSAGFQEYIHLFLLLIIVYLLWNDVGLIYFLAGQFLIIPYLGIIPAPFMNVTWVSDQHLYLALPAFLAFWIRLAEKIPWNKSYLILGFFTLFFGYQTWKTTPVYTSQLAFYKESLKYNPLNVPIAYNLAFTYLQLGQWKEAYYVTSDTFHLGQTEELVRKNPYYPFIVRLYLDMQKGLTPNEN